LKKEHLNFCSNSSPSLVLQTLKPPDLVNATLMRGILTVCHSLTLLELDLVKHASQMLQSAELKTGNLVGFPKYRPSLSILYQPSSKIYWNEPLHSFSISFVEEKDPSSKAKEGAGQSKSEVFSAR